MFKYSCLHFPTTIFPTLPMPTFHPQSHSPLALSMGPSFMFLYIPFLLSHIISLSPPLWLLSVHCPFQCLWLYCLPVCLVNYVPLTGEIIWYLSFTAWLTSLSIILSSSIHVVAKGRNSFCLYAV